jgi:seryl-tRNA synthetase
MAMGEMSDEAEERAWANAIDADGLLRKSIKSLQTQLASAAAERDHLASELVAMTNHCSRQREEVQALTEKRDQLTILLSNAQCAHDMMQRQSEELQAEAVAKHNRDFAIAEAHAKGVTEGKTAAYREVHHWLRPFAGAYPHEPAALLDAMPGLIKRMAECEGVAI